MIIEIYPSLQNEIFVMKQYKRDFLFIGIFLTSIVLGSLSLHILEIPQRVHLLIAVLSAIVIFSILLLKILGKASIIGFFFLGTVVFKMFGVGYLAIFEPDFKIHLLYYFGFFWYYLLLEALYLVRSVKEQDKYHVKNHE